MTNYFIPLEVGRYAIYQLDSSGFYYYGQLDTSTHYLAKDTVEAAITDNEGRPSWRIVRYLNDITGSSAWTPAVSYLVTATDQRIEVQENNLRFIKLAFPLSEGASWNGNSYLPYDPYQVYFKYSDASHLALNSWNYTYQNVNRSFTIGNHQYDSTISVMLIDDSINVPITAPMSFASRSYWKETYAKGIGLVYQHTALWEYQPPPPSGAQLGFKLGFEVTLTLLEHN